MRPFLLGATLLLAFGLAASRDEPSAAQAGVGHIVFARRERPANFERSLIYSVNVQTARRKRVLVPATRVTDFVRSADGSRILFVRSVNGVSALLTSRIDGRRVVRLTPASLPEVDFIDEYGGFTAAFSPNGRWVAFTAFEPCAGSGCAYCGSGGSANPDVYVVRVDGSGLRKVASKGAFPSWSADGQWIAYGGDFIPCSGGPHNGVYIVRRDGSGRRRLATGGLPVFAPRGNQIAYHCAQGGLCTVSLDGSRRSALKLVPASAPVWSPDGARIAVSVGQKGLAIVSFGRPEIRYLLRPRPAAVGSLWPVAWSPDGSRLVYQSGGNARQLYVISTSGRSRPRLLVSQCWCTLFMGARWDDPRHISYGAYTYIAVGKDEIAIMDADGSNLRVVARNGDEPALSPDGRKIAFVRDGVVHLVDANGRHDRSLAPAIAPCGDWCDDGPAWSPDGTNLAFVQKTSETANVPVLVVINSDGSGRRVIATPPPEDGRIAWSPSGDALLMTVASGVTAVDPALFIVDVATGQVRLVPGTEPGLSLDWSSNNRILFASAGIESIAPDGSDLRRVVSAASRGTWSPDGTHVVFLGGSTALGVTIDTVDVQTGVEKTLVKDSAAAGAPDWGT